MKDDLQRSVAEPVMFLRLSSSLLPSAVASERSVSCFSAQGGEGLKLGRGVFG